MQVAAQRVTANTSLEDAVRQVEHELLQKMHASVPGLQCAPREPPPTQQLRTLRLRLLETVCYFFAETCVVVDFLSMTDSVVVVAA